MKKSTPLSQGARKVVFFWGGLKSRYKTPIFTERKSKT